MDPEDILPADVGTVNRSEKPQRPVICVYGEVLNGCALSKVKGHLNLGLNRDGPAVFHGRSEPPLRNRLDSSFIQPESKRLQYIRAFDRAVGRDNNTEQHRTLQSHLARIFGVLWFRSE